MFVVFFYLTFYVFKAFVNQLPASLPNERSELYEGGLKCYTLNNNNDMYMNRFSLYYISN